MTLIKRIDPDWIRELNEKERQEAFRKKVALTILPAIIAAKMKNEPLTAINRDIIIEDTLDFTDAFIEEWNK